MPSNIYDVAKTAIQAEHKAQRTGTPAAREASEPEPAPKEKGGFLQKAADKVRKGFSNPKVEQVAKDLGEGFGRASEWARARRASMPSAEEVEARNPLV